MKRPFSSANWRGSGWPRGALIAVIGLFFPLSIGCFAEQSRSSSSEPTEAPYYDELDLRIDVELMTLNLIKAKLKSPRTTYRDLEMTHSKHKVMLFTGYAIFPDGAADGKTTEKIDAVFWWGGRSKPEMGRVYLGDELLFSNDEVLAKCRELAGDEFR